MTIPSIPAMRRGNDALGLLLLLGLLAAGLAGYLALPGPTAAQTPPNPSNYDADGDGLIEISSLAQLDAVRYDLNGDGVPENAANDAARAAYAAPFPVADGGSICPADATCTGYELTADLDFDTGTAGDRTDDDYYNGGVGWQPIGSDRLRFTGVFDGDGHTISNLYVNRSGADYIGLFASIGNGGEVRNLGMMGVDVTGDENTGGLAGVNRGTITASFVVGTVSGSAFVGGLTSWNHGTISKSYATGTRTGDSRVGGLAAESTGAIISSYAAANVSGNLWSGGLVGVNSGRISASYAAGTVSGNVGGLVGWHQRGPITDSYFDSDISGLSGSRGKTTTELTTPTSYTGIYATWNLDLDGDSTADDPWDFGTNIQYPALKADFNGDDTATWQEFGYQRLAQLVLTATPSGTQAELGWNAVDSSPYPGPPSVSYVLYRNGEKVSGYDGSSLSYTDSGLTEGRVYVYQVALLLNGAEAARSNPVGIGGYDTDGDGLIEISSLAQLDVVRYDLDGDGAADSASNNAAYNAAFPGTADGLVCFSCAGYELTADLDFDTGTAGDRTDDAYYNNGAGWQPIGSSGARFAGVFDGDGHTISNLHVNRTSTNGVGLFSYIGSGGTVRNLGLPNVSVSGRQDVGGLAGRSYGSVSTVFVTGAVTGSVVDAGGIMGWSRGTISQSYVVARVSGSTTVGGLAGSSHGTITASYAAGTVSGHTNGGGLVGFMEDADASIKNSYSTAEVTLTGRNPSDYGGVLGENRRGAISASYFDSESQSVPGIGPVGSGSATGAAGKSSLELTGPMGYTGIYATWDDDGSDVWDFGTNIQYPALKVDFNGDDTATWQEFGPYQNPRAEVDVEPTFGTATVDAQSYTENTDVGIVSLPEATSGNPLVTYSLMPELPAGLSFDAAALSITGAPAEPQDATEYTYTVTDADDDTASLTFTIAIANNPPYLLRTVSDKSYTEGVYIRPGYLPIARGGDGGLTYTLEPELPPGLSLGRPSGPLVEDPVPGSNESFTISGAPTEPQDATEYTYTVTDGDGETASLTFTIAIANNPPDFGSESVAAQSYMENEDVGTVTLPEATSGDGALAYTLTPELPAGLAFDAAARSISGTPTESQAETEYTYTATDGDGETAELTFTIEVEAEPVTVTETALGEGDDTIINAAESEDGITLTGMTTPGASVSVSYGGEVLATTTADPETGEWSVTVPADSLPEGAVTVAVAASMEDGRSAEVEYQFSIDRIAPEVTPVELVMSPTNDNTPEVVISSSEPGTVVYGGDCGAATPAAIATADTHTRLTYPQLSDGEYSGCSVAVTDAAGNTGHPAVHPSFWDIVVDTQAPVLESSTVYPVGEIVLRFSEEISWFERPDIGAFTVLVDGDKEVTEVVFLAIGWHGNGHDQREVLLELSWPVPEGAWVVVTYHHTDAWLSPFQDHAGNLFPSGDYQVSP